MRESGLNTSLYSRKIHMRFFPSEAYHRTLTLAICQVLWLGVSACSGDTADDSNVDVELDADQGSGEGDTVPAVPPDCEDPCELVFQNINFERPSNFAQITLVNRQTQPIDVIGIRLENSSTATGFTRSTGQMLVN